jgi:hypothetical protein
MGFIPGNKNDIWEAILAESTPRILWSSSFERHLSDHQSALGPRLFPLGAKIVPRQITDLRARWKPGCVMLEQ